jgi:hypothetical protein
MNAIRVSLGIALLALPAAAQSKFDGKWEFNLSLSKNVGMMAQMKLHATVRHSRDEMIITSVSSFNSSPDQTSELRFDLTGKPVSNKAPMEAAAETVTKWDGNRLVTTWTSDGSVAGTKSVRTETRFLSDDGRTMTVESKRGNAPPIVMVYERK